MSKSLDDVLSQWAGLGVPFNKQPADGDADIERLLLDTARWIPEMARLYIMSVTWLQARGDRIDVDRLARLISEELDPAHHATLGLLLESAQEHTQSSPFQSIIERLEPAKVSMPLFKTARKNAKLAEWVKRRASPLSLKWNLWAQPVELKHDAIRPKE